MPADETERLIAMLGRPSQTIYTMHGVIRTAVCPSTIRCPLHDAVR